jgi:hypothetical protein
LDGDRIVTVIPGTRIYVGSVEAGAIFKEEEKAWPVWTPADFPGLSIWFDASQLGLADGAAVSPWPNLGSGADGPVIGTPAPVVRANALNSLPVVRFAVDQGRIRMTGTGVDKDYTLVYVSRIYGYGGQRVVNANYPPANLLFGYWYGNRDVAYSTPGFFTPNTQTPHTPPTYPWFLYSGDGASTPSYVPRFFKNGVLLGSGPGSSDGWMGYFNISGYQEPGTAETSECEIAEVLLYNRKLSDTERIQVEDYLRAKWGL